MALLDLTGQNIENTYQRILQTDGTLIYDGTGSIVNLPTGSFVTTSSFNAFTSSYNTGSFTGSLFGTASYALTSSFASQAISASNATSASYAATASYLSSLESELNNVLIFNLFIS